MAICVLSVCGGIISRTSLMGKDECCYLFEWSGWTGILLSNHSKTKLVLLPIRSLNKY